MAANAALTRLRRELKCILEDPNPNIHTLPNPKNMLEWHYAIIGPQGTPYEGGIYHGKLIFPSEYPLKPPSILMITPNGRFETNKRICLSMSDFHPESWNPMWSVASGLLSFMLEEAATAGSISTSIAEKRRLAALSHSINRTNPMFRKDAPASTINNNTSSTTATVADAGNAGRVGAQPQFGTVGVIITVLVSVVLLMFINRLL